MNKKMLYAEINKNMEKLFQISKDEVKKYLSCFPSHVIKLPLSEQIPINLFDADFNSELCNLLSISLNDNEIIIHVKKNDKVISVTFAKNVMNNNEYFINDFEIIQILEVIENKINEILYIYKKLENLNK